MYVIFIYVAFFNNIIIYMYIEPGTGSISNWRRRYFILLSDRLWYFEMIHKGDINLIDGVSAHSDHLIEPTESQDRRMFAGAQTETRFSYRYVCSRIFIHDYFFVCGYD